MRNLMGYVVIAFCMTIAVCSASLNSELKNRDTNKAKGTTIVKQGKPLATIYVNWPLNKVLDPHKEKFIPVSARFLNQARHQIETDLNYHIKEISGITLNIVETSDPSMVTAPAIVLGDLAVRMGATPKQTTETKESFRIISKDGLVLIGGESDIAAMYGMYEILESIGCDWIMPGQMGEVIPKKETIILPDMDIYGSPSFLIRSPWYSGGGRIVTVKERTEFDEWKLRHKNQPSYLHHGFHPLQMIGGHVWGQLVKQFKKEFEEDPTMLALVRLPDGTLKRKGPQVETTNPKVIKLFETYIKDIFKKNKWPNDKMVSLGVGPADGAGFSESPESQLAGSGRIDPIMCGADITDLQILLCNTLLENLTKEYPNLYLGFYLYNLHHDYPMRYKPHPHVEVVIADISYSRFNSTLEPGIRSRKYYRTILEQWENLHKEQGNPMMFRGYNFNLAECLLPYTKLKMWGEDIPLYKNMGCFGTYIEWNKNWSNTGPSDYLEAKLNWDASLKWKDVLSYYCKSAFGGGAPFMEKYYLNLVKTQHASKNDIGSFHNVHLIYNNEFISKSNELFDKALAAANSPQAKQLITCYREPLEMLDIYLEYRSAFTNYDFKKAKELYADMLALWDKYYKINSNLVSKSGPIYLNRFQNKFINQGLKYSSGEYRIVEKIPEKLITMLDPYVKGQELDFQSPAIDDSRFIKTSTWDLPWDAQGLGAYFSGAIWYRIPLSIPESIEKKPLGLFLGGVDSIARVYLNGNYIGTGRGFSIPMVFDITENIKYGEENLLAIQIQHTGISELGTFGIIYPSFIFTGPRLEQKAPVMKPLRRILPGGALGDYE